MKTILIFVFVLVVSLCFAQETVTKAQNPIIIVDGIKYLRSDSIHVLKHLNPEKIKSIDILKGQDAINLFGEDGKSGVIVVTTKAGVIDKPLFILDGKRIEDISSLNPDDIQSIEVIKDATQLIPYGDEGRLGVVKITSKSKGRYR
jgi:bla regulator protein blaR1